MVLLGYSVGKNRPSQPAPKNNPPETTAKFQSKWNPALGDVVLLVPELGFRVRGIKNTSSSDEAKISKRIEAQLFGVRQVYHREVEKNSSLAGAMLLEVELNPSGDVTQVRELASRLPDGEFKKAVLAEVSNWQFHEMVSDAMKITAPLLFVRQGMDVTTLVQWEKALGSFPEATSVAKDEGLNTEKRASKSAKINQERKPPRQNFQIRTVGVYQLVSPATLRREPSFGAATLANVAAGTRVMVVAVRGDWLEIQANERGPSGFIRKELARPVDAVGRP